MNSKLSIMFMVCTLVSAPAIADVILLEASIDGAQANNGSGTGSAGTGTATLSFDNVTKDLSWNIEWSGLLGSATAAHFHGPASPLAGAGVQQNIGVSSNNP